MGRIAMATISPSAAEIVRQSGAIPGAAHVEWTRNLGPDGSFKPAAELRAMYEQAGVTPDKATNRSRSGWTL